jgi:hypothetical protein
MSSASDRISEATPSHVWSLRAECTDINGWKAAVVNVHALAMEPIIARLTTVQRQLYIHIRQVS